MYHYTESGLPNVWLANGYKLRICADGEEEISIEDADELHALIGRTLSAKAHLSGREFRFLRKELDLSQNRLANWIGLTEDMVSKWERQGRVPKSACRFIQAMYLEKVDGNVKITELIERLANLDRAPESKLVLEDTDTGWRMAA